jgi:hypothetical protein
VEGFVGNLCISSLYPLAGSLYMSSPTRRRRTESVIIVVVCDASTTMTRARAGTAVSRVASR